MPDNAAPLLLLTRPTRVAERFAARFDGQIEVVIAPLQEIVPLEVTLNLASVGALAFTSGHAVERFATLSARRDIPAFCVGDRTAEVAQEIGLAATSAAGTVDDLAALILAAAPRGEILHLHGQHLRGDLTSACDRAASMQEGWRSMRRRPARHPRHSARRSQAGAPSSRHFSRPAAPNSLPKHLVRRRSKVLSCPVSARPSTRPCQAICEPLPTLPQRPMPRHWLRQYRDIFPPSGALRGMRPLAKLTRVLCRARQLDACFAIEGMAWWQGRPQTARAVAIRRMRIKETPVPPTM
ncbi:uroporphyrinogen-III synthase [Fontisubflavum oceani]|uniref:uroporphyrinogen-III synthase n=1 Tax=Fontisubflavum oceani TaxID=2978973 RepID=UPI0038B274C7